MDGSECESGHAYSKNDKNLKQHWVISEAIRDKRGIIQFIFERKEVLFERRCCYNESLCHFTVS